MSVLAADLASIFPGVQQVIGAGTVVSNAVKCCVDKIQISKLEKQLLEFGKQEAELKSVNVVVTDATLTQSITLPQMISETEAQIEAKKAELAQHKKFIDVGFKRSVPIVGSFVSINRAGMTQANFWSILPVFQQVIGACTLAKNGFLAIKEKFQLRSITNEIKKSTEELTGNKASFKQLQDQYKKQVSENADQAAINVTVESMQTNSQTENEIKSNKADLIQTKRGLLESFPEHKASAWLGLARMIPVIGTAVSLHECYKNIKATSVTTA